MAVCNIFNELKNSTGTFLMFSQYTEDLTRGATQKTYYHIVPSKFITANVNYENFNNTTLVLELQNKFENGCAICRKAMEEVWTPIHSSNLFWDMMFDSNLLTMKDYKIVDKNKSEIFVNKIDEINYIGDINIQSYNEHDGIGYSEVYCYIPNDAKEYRYGRDVVDTIGDTYTSGDVIEGYDFDELNAGWTQIHEAINYHPYKETSILMDSDDVISIDSDKFNINTVILLYDIYSVNQLGDEVIYKNIPMGIYFTGLIDAGKMTNEITKYVYNKDIYGMGTSYGLRVCSRYTVSPNQDNIKVLDVTVRDDNYAAISMIMSQMSKSQNKMDEIISKIQNKADMDKELLAIFKNSKTNVPYIRKVNGISHWFVNGRNQGPVLGEMDCEYIPYEKEEIYNMLYNSNAIIIKLFAHRLNGNDYVFEYGKDNPQDVMIRWEITYNDNPIEPDELYLNGIQLDPSTLNIVENSTYNTKTYNLLLKKDDLIKEAKTSIYWCYPTFFGSIPCASCQRDDHSLNPQVTDITNLQKYLRISKENEFTYTNLAYTDINNPLGAIDHICLAYPKEYGYLTSVTDEYGYEYIDDFEVYEKEIFIDNKNVSYYVYIDHTPAEVQDYKLKFK
jgi:hypothetical protein